MKKILNFMAILALVGGIAACNKNNGPEGTDGTGGSGDSSDGIQAVDLGLSVKWASCNIGGQKESDSGYCFAWGETEEKRKYDWIQEGDYKWGKDGGKKPLYGMAKYTADAAGGDGLKTLQPDDDPATVSWGSKWRTPTVEEIEELIEKCEWKWGNNGCTITSPTTGKSIFLPALGYRYGSGSQYSGKYGCYWSSTVDESNVSQACYLRFSSDEIISTEGGRFCGLRVRAVSDY